MKSDPVILDAKQRACVIKAIRETCSIRGWSLQAINVRTNHVHAVVKAGTVGPGKVINALKANATRTLREAGVWHRETTPWVDKGSTRYLWNEESISKACDYVRYDQGEDLPEF
jgi:REP element-mobilizing transposase RayT